MAGRTVGILALQGDVCLHAKAFEKLGITTVLVKKPEQLDKVDGLIIPGGESTTLLKLAEPLGFLDAIKNFSKPIFGTCAGAILLSKKVTNPDQISLGLIDITIQRNAYGRQIDSIDSLGEQHEPLGTGSLPMTFIRAPRITTIGNKVKVLATHNNEPVLVAQNNVLVATFHPELTNDLNVYEYWLKNFRS